MKNYLLKRTSFFLLSILIPALSLYGSQELSLSQPSVVPIVHESEIDSLHLFSKDDQVVYIFGVTPPPGKKSSDSPFPQMYENFFQQLSASATPSTFILMMSKEIVSEIASGKRSVNTTNFDGLALHQAAHNNFKKGSILYIPWQYKDAMLIKGFDNSYLYYMMTPEKIVTLASANGINVAYSIKLYFWLHSLLTNTEIDASFKEPHILALKPKEDPFLKEPRFFKDLKNVIIKDSNKNASHPSLAQYLRLLDTYDKKFQGLADNPFISSLKEEWLSVLEKTRCYLKASGCKPQSKLIEVLLNGVQKKKLFLPAYEEFQSTVGACLNTIKALEQALLLIEALSTSKRIIFWCHPLCVGSYSKPFCNLGFKHTVVGLSSSHQDIAVLSSTNNLSAEELQSYFNSIITTTFEEAASTFKRENVPLKYFDITSTTAALLPHPLKDHTQRDCLKCTNKRETCKGFLVQENTFYCSLTCLREKLFEKEETSLKLCELLDENHVLSDKEKLVLKRCGALFYLRAALLMPSLTQEDGIVYQLPLTTLIERLKKLSECFDKDLSEEWKQALEICSAWKTEVKTLSMNLQLFHMIKQAYLKDLFKKALDKSYYETDEEDCLFDSKGQLSKMQDMWFKTLKTAFTFSDSKENDTALLFLYGDLVERINKRIGIPFDTIEKALTIDYHLEDLDKVLGSIGYNQNPLKIRQRKDRIHQVVSSDEESAEKISLSSEEGEETDNQSSKAGALHTDPALLGTSGGTFTPFCTTTTTSASVFAEGFKPAYTARNRFKKICSTFGGSKAYTITLFKARNVAPEDLYKAHEQWKTCTSTKEAFRIRILFALAQEAVQQELDCVYYNSYNVLALHSLNEADESFHKKLDIHHLFSRSVDSFLESYGIAESVGDTLIQVSIPGKLEYEDKKKIGFFQYSFTPDWVCIHRCFKPYTASRISPALRKTLHDFLVKEDVNGEYAEVIGQLKGMLGV